MTQPLFAIENTFAGNLVTLARDLTKDDVVLTPTNTQPLSDDADMSFLPSVVRYGYGIALNMDNIWAMIDALEIDVNKDRNRYSGSKRLFSLTDQWNVNDPVIFIAYKKQDVNFRGLRTVDAKRKRFNKLIDEVKIDFLENKDDLIQSALDEIKGAIEHNLSEQRKKVKESMKNIIVDQNVNDIDSLMTEEEKAESNALSDEESQLKAKLDAILEKRKQTKQQHHQLKRTVLFREANRQLEEGGRALLAELEDVKSEPKSAFGSFLE